jgi:hypothetical protein
MAASRHDPDAAPDLDERADPIPVAGRMAGADLAEPVDRIAVGDPHLDDP